MVNENVLHEKLLIALPYVAKNIKSRLMDLEKPMKSTNSEFPIR